MDHKLAMGSIFAIIAMSLLACGSSAEIEYKQPAIGKYPDSKLVRETTNYVVVSSELIEDNCPVFDNWQVSYTVPRDFGLEERFVLNAFGSGYMNPVFYFESCNRFRTDSIICHTDFNQYILNRSITVDADHQSAEYNIVVDYFGAICTANFKLVVERQTEMGE